MEQDKIKELLKKFENAETSLNEEAILKDFFTTNEVRPGDLHEYKLYFTWANDLKEVQAPETLSNKIATQLNEKEQKDEDARIVIFKSWSSWAAAS